MTLYAQTINIKVSNLPEELAKQHCRHPKSLPTMHFCHSRKILLITLGKDSDNMCEKMVGTVDSSPQVLGPVIPESHTLSKAYHFFCYNKIPNSLPWAKELGYLLVYNSTNLSLLESPHLDSSLLGQERQTTQPCSVSAKYSKAF